LIENRNWSKIDQLQRSDLVAYVEARLKENVRPNTIRTDLTTFRSLWREWLAEELVTNTAVLQVKGPEVGDPLPRYLTLVEYQRLENVVQNQTAQTGPEDRLHQAWFYLLAHTGVRSSELFNLRVQDCYLAGGRLRVRSGKGNRDRSIPLTAQLSTILQAYLAIREPASSDHLLVHHHQPLDRNIVVRKLREWGHQAGIAPLTPHHLRHTLATLLINQGMPITSLQKLLGHRHISNTMVYARVHDETVKQQFSSAMSQIECIPIPDWPKQMIKSSNTTEHTFDSV
jgi:integrase/recombinase XerD